MRTRMGAVAAVLVLAVFLGIDASAQKRRRLASDCGKCDGDAWIEIVNAGGKCLDAHDPTRRTNGGMVHLWACGGDESQQWRWGSGPANGYRALVNQGGLCLAIAEAKPGGAIQVRRCNDRPEQQWRLEARALTSAGGYCLDAHVETLRQNDGRVQVWGCAPPGGLPQTWRAAALGEPAN